MLLPRDVDLSEDALRRAFTPHPQQQRITLYFLAGSVVLVGLIYTAAVASPRLRRIQVLIYPLMLLNTTVHELGHALGVIATGKWPHTMTIFLNSGGVTIWNGADKGLRTFALVTPAGYIGSGVYAASLSFGGFSILGSKIATLVQTVVLVIAFVLVKKDVVSVPVILFFLLSECAVSCKQTTQADTLLAPAPLWLLEQSRYLRFYILFLGGGLASYNLVLMLATVALVEMTGSGEQHRVLQLHVLVMVTDCRRSRRGRVGKDRRRSRKGKHCRSVQCSALLTVLSVLGLALDPDRFLPLRCCSAGRDRAGAFP